MVKSIPAAEVKKVIIACEAGMGSSLMAANKLKRMLKKAGLKHIKVKHSPVRSIPEDAQVVFSHKGLADMTRSKAPWAVCYTFTNFVNIPAFDTLVTALKNGDVIEE